jgi:hypothetical protein
MPILLQLLALPLLPAVPLPQLIHRKLLLLLLLLSNLEFVLCTAINIML